MCWSRLLPVIEHLTSVPAAGRSDRVILTGPRIDRPAATYSGGGGPDGPRPRPANRRRDGHGSRERCDASVGAAIDDNHRLAAGTVPRMRGMGTGRRWRQVG